MAYEELEPTTRQKLGELARRRRALLVMRAVFAGILTLLLTMALVAVVDRLVVLSQPLRIVLSLAAYMSVAFVVYRVSLRYLLRFPSPARLARLIESAEPSLREDLVSAVELAKDTTSVYDSPAFREVLQRNVAKKVQAVDTERVLPWRLVAWWAAVSSGAVVVTVALILTPGLRYGELLTRAMLPTADLDRVSDVRITLLSPDLDEHGRVPMNANLPVRVEVSGGQFDKVMIEVVDDQGEQDGLRMRHDGGSDERFVADLAVGDRPMKFRVTAGDGQTRYYELDPTARPAIARFSQVVHPPQYTGWEPMRTGSDSGDIDALAGSVVDLTLSANQPIEQGRLVLELAEGEKTLPLYVDPADATVLTTSLPIEHSGTYRVDLVALDTAFANDDARRYEITARADALPHVRLVTPKGTLGQQADALVQLTGRAGDDVGLREVARELRVNGGKWQREVVSVDGRGAVASALDLLPIGLRVGDEVELRLSATDLAGHRAQSSSARIVVTPDGYELASADAVVAQRALLAALDRAVESADRARRLYQAASGGEAIADRRARAQALAAESVLHDDLVLADRAVEAALGVSRPGAGGDVLVQAGRAIAEARMRVVQSPVSLSDESGMRNAHRGAEQARNALRLAAGDVRSRVAALEMAVVLQQTRVLASDMSRVADQVQQDRLVDADLAQQRLQRRVGLARSQADVLARRIDALAKQKEVKPYHDRLEQTADAIRELLNQRGHGGGDGQLTLAQALHTSLEHSEQRQWPTWVHLADQDEDEQRRQPKSIRLDADAIGRLKHNLKAGTLDVALGSVVQRLRRRAQLEELKPVPDSAFVAMTGVAATALDQLGLDRAAAGDSHALDKRLGSIHVAYATLERVQGVANLRAMVLGLAKAERQGESDDRLPLEHRLDWSVIKPRFNAVHHALQQDKSLADTAKRVRQADQSDASRRVRQVMNGRRQLAPQSRAVHAELDEIAKMLAQALEAAAPALAEARLALSAQTPSLPERMRDLAKRAERLSAESREAAQQSRDAPEPEVMKRVEQLAMKQMAVNAALAALTQELRREANRQDLFTEQGRETARDMDDAIAMLRPDAEEADRQLALAQRQTTRAHERPDAIDAAAQAQQQTAQTLEQLADHFDQTEQDAARAEQSRQALREAEEELGIADELDAQYERMEKLAELARLSDEQRLAQLERQLKQDRGMQRELDRIADDLAGRAQQRLNDAARQERALAQQFAQTRAQEQRLVDPSEQAIDELAVQAGRLERDRVRPLEQQAQRGAPQARPKIQQSQKALNRAAAQADSDQEQAQQQGRAQEQRERIEKLAQATREAAGALGQAAEEAQAEEQAARERHQKARREADKANKQGVAAPEAAREVIQAARQQERAAAVREEAQDVARRADDLAKRAEALNKEAGIQGERADQQRAEGAADQRELAEQAHRASDELERAARHEQRLGDPKRAKALAKSGEQTRDLAKQALPKAGEAIEKQGPLDQAEQAAREAEQALREQADQVEQARQAKSQDRQPGAGEQHGESQTDAPGDPQQAGEAGENPGPGESPSEGDKPSGGEPQGQSNEGQGQQGEGEKGQGQQGEAEASQGEQTHKEQGQGQEGQGQQAEREQGTGASGQGEQGQKGEGEQGEGQGQQTEGQQGQGKEGQGEPGQGEQGQADPSGEQGPGEGQGKSPSSNQGEGQGKPSEAGEQGQGQPGGEPSAGEQSQGRSALGSIAITRV